LGRRPAGGQPFRIAVDEASQCVPGTGSDTARPDSGRASRAMSAPTLYATSIRTRIGVYAWSFDSIVPLAELSAASSWSSAS
jgi:hypothetical protein